MQAWSTALRLKSLPLPSILSFGQQNQPNQHPCPCLYSLQSELEGLARGRLGLPWVQPMQWCHGGACHDAGRHWRKALQLGPWCTRRQVRLPPQLLLHNLLVFVQPRAGNMLVDTGGQAWAVNSSQTCTQDEVSSPQVLCVHQGAALCLSECTDRKVHRSKAIVMCDSSNGRHLLCVCVQG